MGWGAGTISSRVAWESGTSAALNMPWIRRQTISCSRVCAAPEQMEKAVKPRMQVTNMNLRPKRAASQASPAAYYHGRPNSVGLNCRLTRQMLYNRPHGTKP